MFREDLWYRINVFPISLPRLRERQADIPTLVRHFAQRAAHRFGLPAAEPTAADLHLLLQYSWPGNIRELAAVIDRAAILGNGAKLDIAAALGSGGHVSPPPAPPFAPTLYEVIPEAVSAPVTPPPQTLAAAMKVSLRQACNFLIWCWHHLRALI
jgi:DNA-binding NtrC family response regulator